jgi:hypothetical protein
MIPHVRARRRRHGGQTDRAPAEDSARLHLPRKYPHKSAASFIHMRKNAATAVMGSFRDHLYSRCRRAA